MFQSTHPRRVRLLPCLQACSASGFNPRTHVGCDNDMVPPYERENGFNPRTHVGCDDVLESTFKDKGFQSTHPRRVRLSADMTLTQIEEFQSTHPRRVRLCRSCRREALRCFNPRTHVGCDTFSYWRHFAVSSFNPRTHVGCDPFVQIGSDTTNVSIHAPT